MIVIDSAGAETAYVEGLRSYYETNLDEAIRLFQQALKCDHKHSKAEEMLSKAEGLNESKGAGNFFT